MDEASGSCHAPQLGAPLGILIKSMQHVTYYYYAALAIIMHHHDTILVTVYPFPEDDSSSLRYIQHQLSSVGGPPQVSERGSRRDSWTMVGTRAG